MILPANVTRVWMLLFSRYSSSSLRRVDSMGKASQSHAKPWGSAGRPKEVPFMLERKRSKLSRRILRNLGSLVIWTRPKAAFISVDFMLYPITPYRNLPS